MTETQTKTPMELYRALRDRQNSKALAAQLQALAVRVLDTSGRVPRVSGGKASLAGAPDPTNLRALRTHFPRHKVFFVKFPPYTSGKPNPESASKTAGTAEGAYFNIEAFGDPVRGRLSVGVNAGITRDADWTGNTYYSALPDRWLLGDAITSTASILQVVDLPQGLAVGSDLTVIVEFGWDPMYRGWRENLVYDALATTPGLSSSPFGGFVGVSAMAGLNVSLASEDAILGSSEAFNNILNLAVNAEFYGNRVQDQTEAPYLFFDFAFAGNPWAPINLIASVPLEEGAKQMIVETSVRLVGGRGGVNDPNAGYVTAAFMDLYEGASPVSYVPSSPNPFVVNRITAFSSSF